VGNHDGDHAINAAKGNGYAATISQQPAGLVHVGLADRRSTGLTIEKVSRFLAVFAAACFIGTRPTHRNIADWIVGIGRFGSNATAKPAAARFQ
jgi:hypothetical protein